MNEKVSTVPPDLVETINKVFSSINFLSYS